MNDLLIVAGLKDTGKVFSTRPRPSEFHLTFSGGGGAYHYNASGLLAPATADVPVLAYDAEGDVLGLWGGGAITNAVLQSGDFANAVFSKTELDVVNLTDGQLLRPTTANAGHFISQTLAGTAQGSSYGYFKPSGYRFIQVTTLDVDYVNIDLLTLDTFASSADVTALVKQEANGFIRAGMVRTGTHQSFRVAIVNSLAATRFQAFVGDGVSGVIAKFPQKTGNTFFQPYVATTATAVTAPANIITGALPASITAASAISGACVVNVPADSGGVQQYIFDIVNDTGDERITMFKNVAGQISLLTITASGTNTTTSTATFPVDQNVALSWTVSLNSIKFYMNGVLVGTRTDAGFPSVNTIYLMSRFSSVDFLQGYMRLIALKGEAVDDATLIAWSTL